MSFTQNMSNDDVKECILSFLKQINRPGIDELIDYLCNKSDFFTAPASTRFHLSEPGGLARHSLNVYYRLYALVTNERNTYHNLEENQAAIDESLIIIGLLHDLCKTNFYQQSTRNVKNKQTGQWEEVPYYSIEDTLPMGHCEKSLYMIQGFIKLTRDEAMAIRWHMGFSDAAVKGGDYSLNQAFEKYPLAVLAHAADFMASNLDETKGV